MIWLKYIGRWFVRQRQVRPLSIERHTPEPLGSAVAATTACHHRRRHGPPRPAAVVSGIESNTGAAAFGGSCQRDFDLRVDDAWQRLP